MKVYINWEWGKIVKTEIEAKDFMVENRICYNLSEYLVNELDLTIEEIFNLCEDEKIRIFSEYLRYLDEAVKDYWEIVEI